VELAYKYNLDILAIQEPYNAMKNKFIPNSKANFPYYLCCENNNTALLVKKLSNRYWEKKNLLDPFQRGNI